MSLQPEEAQRLTDLRQHMLKNVQQGKPPHDGLTPEILNQALGFLRRNREAATAVAEKKTKAATKKQLKQKESTVDPNLFAGFDFD